MTTRGSFRITGKWVLKAFLIGFGVIFAANALLIYYALNSWTGLETEQAYDKGLAHNEVLKSAEAQSRLGWTVDVAFEVVNEKGDGREGLLSVRVADKQSAPVDRLAGRAILWRPTHEGSDQREPLKGVGDGTYEASILLPAAGQWDVRLELIGASEPYRLRRRIVVQ